MPKSSNFFGQPIYGQLIKSLDREKIVGMQSPRANAILAKMFEKFDSRG